MTPKLLRIACAAFVLGLSALPGHSQTTFNFTHNQPGLLTASAGGDLTMCVGETLPIGGNPTAGGGTSPFTYNWTPTTDLSSGTAANPDVTPSGISNTDYMVMVTDDRGCTASDTMNVVADTCAGVTDIAGLGTFNLFPNPSNGNFAVELSLIKNVNNIRYTVVTAEGKVIFDRAVAAPGRTTREEIRLTNVAKGNYFLKVELDGVSATKTLIIQ